MLHKITQLFSIYQSHSPPFWGNYSSDPEEIAAYLQEQGSRARTQARNDEPVRRLLARLRGEKIIRVRSYIRRAKAESTPDGQEKWEV